VSNAQIFDLPAIYPAITILERKTHDFIRSTKIGNRIFGKIKIVLVKKDDISMLRKLPKVMSTKEVGDFAEYEIYEMDQDKFCDRDDFLFEIQLEPKLSNVLKKIDSGCVKLGRISLISCGTPRSKDYYAWGEHLTDEKPDSKTEFAKYLVCRNISPYQIRWGIRINSMKKTFNHPYLIYDSRLFTDGKWKLFKTKKILIRGNDTRLTAAYDDVGYAAVGIYAVSSLKMDDTYVLGILNSRLMNFYYLARYATTHVAGGYISFNGVYLESLPIKIPKTSEEKQIFSRIVEKVEAILQSMELHRLLEGFPDIYLEEYKSRGAEFDQIEYTFDAGHDALEPIITRQPGGGYVVYPSRDEDPIWADTEEKARYIVLALKNKCVRENDSIKILVPKDNATVFEILNEFRKLVEEREGISKSDLAGHIDDLVYKLYGLDDTDRAIVEAFLAKYFKSEENSQ